VITSIKRDSLRTKGFDAAALTAVEAALASAFDIKFAFNKWTLGEDYCIERLGVARRARLIIRLSSCWRRSASPRPRSTPPTASAVVP
jgi:hypothetical protein